MREKEQFVTVTVEKDASINQLIQEKCAIEQLYQDTRLVLTRVEGILKERSEYHRLEELVNQLQAFVMINKSGVKRQFSDDDKLLIRELFGIQPGDVVLP